MRGKCCFAALAMVAVFFFFGAGSAGSQTGKGKSGEIRISSPAFRAGTMIPARYTCDGENISPPLEWEGLPPGTRSIALTCDDPDAPMGTWVHWVLFNLPATVKGLPGNIPPHRALENGAMQGKNDFRRTGYGGPCPPSGIHRYYFRIYALDTVLRFAPGAVSRARLLDAMKGHILAKGCLMGTYRRR